MLNISLEVVLFLNRLTKWPNAIHINRLYRRPLNGYLACEDV